MAAPFTVVLLWVVLIAIFAFSLEAVFGYSSERLLSGGNMMEGGFMRPGLLLIRFAAALTAGARHFGLHFSPPTGKADRS
ncbi:MAG: hypothetical protein KQI78_00660 [Deltaproteobacteria bacterium]|nr:hypothetical protein [Deltaproteobacteria bacterium]